MCDKNSIKTGSSCLIILALLIVGVALLFDMFFSTPAYTYNGMSSIFDVFATMSSAMRTYLTIYALVPLFLIPGAVGIFNAFRENSGESMRIATYFAVLAAFAWTFSLLLWPGLNWPIAHSLASHPNQAVEVASLTQLASGLNIFVGVYIGQYLMQACFIIWTVLVVRAVYQDSEVGNWIGLIGALYAIIAFIALILKVLNVSGFMVYELQLVPLNALWLFVLGVGILGYKK